ncbi:MAG: fumarate hydratase [bacterium]
MREIEASKITECVERLCREAAFYLPEDVKARFREMQANEESPVGRLVMEQLLANAEIAANEQVPMCQDTGLAVVFVEWGQDCHLSGATLQEAVDEGVRRAYKDNFLRKSVYSHPYRRDKNTGDNTPAIVHLKMVAGDKVKITLAAKGGGSENMSAVAMMKPADGVEGVKRFVVEQVKKAGSNPCPPIIVGVGIGGNFERVAQLAKESLLCPLDEANPDPELAALEAELLELVNKTGVGPGGLGGTQTAAAVKVKMAPCHIASFPVAVNIQCNAARHKEGEV